MNKQDHLSKIPSVNILLEKLAASFPHIAPVYLKRLITAELDNVRLRPAQYKLSQTDRTKVETHLLAALTNRLSRLLSGTLKPVINATGVTLHTGLGRAPLSPGLVDNLVKVSAYCNLEIDLESGRRGQRNDHLAPLLRILTGAEDGMAVNNNAAAVMLMLNTVGNRREVIISRGEMIEIGGSFRLPEVMRLSGCKLKEVGTTNKTHLNDYHDAITPKTAAILICHPSNYQVQGFSDKPALQEIVRLAHMKGIPALYDLGSGALTDIGLPDTEPQVARVVANEVDLISFSGDKLLGGPQAGVIVGKQEWVQKCARNHLTRALRLDKFIIKLLQDTLINYLTNNSMPANINSALTVDAETLLARCRNFVASLPAIPDCSVDIAPSKGKVGSGAYPVLELNSFAIKIKPGEYSAQKMADRLRKREYPVICYIDKDSICIDLRTVTPAEEPELKAALAEMFYHPNQQ
jgi:L-seryl-tRNA(Ser) seleniumtransferase